MRPQARFRHVTDDQIGGIQEETARKWEKLLKADETGQIIL
jgi:hypothetical protein